MKIKYLFFLFLISNSSGLFSQNKPLPLDRPIAKFISISSLPVNANILVTKSKVVAETTPMNSLPLSFSAKELIVFQDGYYPYLLSLRYDSVFKDLKVNLREFSPAFKAKSTYKFQFNKIIYAIDQNQWIGRSSIGDVNYDKAAYEPFLERDKGKIIQSVEKAFYDDSLNILKTSNQIFKEDNSDVSFVIGAEVYDLWHGSTFKKTYTKINVRWLVYDLRKGKVVGTFESVGASFVIKDGTAGFMDQAMYSAARTLSLNTDFQKLISKTPKIEGDTIKEVTFIDKFKPYTFSSQGELYKVAIESTVTVKTDFGHGSGVIVSKTGGIITNYHVVEDAQKIEIIFSNDLILEAEVIKVNKERDVAFLKVKAGAGFKPLPINNSGDLSVGTDVLAIGTPEDISLGQSITKGIVSGKRKIEGQTYIQTDVSINSGNSGGPLINTQGEIVGIVVSKVKQVGTEGLGFVIPINEALQALKIEIKDN